MHSCVGSFQAFFQSLSLWTNTLNPLCFLFILSCLSASIASWGLKYFAPWQYLLDFLQLNNSSSLPSPPLFSWTETYSFWFISSLTSLSFLFTNTVFFLFFDDESSFLSLFSISFFFLIPDRGLQDLLKNVWWYLLLVVRHFGMLFG